MQLAIQVGGGQVRHDKTGIEARRYAAEQPQSDPAPGPHRSGFPPTQGPDDDAEPARHGQPRADALTWRPHRRQRSRRQRARRGPGLQEVPRRVRGAARERRTDQQPRHAALHRLHPAGDLPPNPIRNLNNALSGAAQTGRNFYFGPTSDAFANCNTCHVRVAVRLTLADGDGWCADAPARSSGNPPSTAKHDRIDKFTGQKKTPPPAGCPALRGSPSGAFVLDAAGG